MKVSSKGQITIPQAMRNRYGLLPQSDVEFRQHKDGVLIVKSGKGGRGQYVLDTMRRGGRIQGTTAQLLRVTRGD